MLISVAFRIIVSSNSAGNLVTISYGEIPVNADTIKVYAHKRGAFLQVLQVTDTLPLTITSFVSESGFIYEVFGVVQDIAGVILAVSPVVSVFAQEVSLDIDLIDDVAEYMEASGLGTVGTDIFKYRFPQTRNECFVIIPTGGAEPDVNRACGQEELRFVLQYRSLEDRPQIGFKRLTNAKRILHSAGNTLTKRKGIIEALSSGPVDLGAEAADDNRMNVHSIAFRFRGTKVA